MTRIARGLEAARKGGLPGVLDPSVVGATPYGAPNARYGIAEQARQAQVGSDDQQIAQAVQQFKETMAGKGKAAGLAKDAATAYNDATKGAEGLLDANTKAQAETDAAGARRDNSPEGIAAAEQAKFAQLEAQADRIFGGPGKGGTMRQRYLARATGGELPTPNQMSRGGAAGGSPTLPAGQPGQTGDAYLATLPPATAATVKAIGEGREAPPAAANRSKEAQAILGALNQSYPGYDATKFPTYAATRKAFTSGPIGTAINSFNTAITHLNALESHLPDNTALPAANAVQNWWRSATGSAALQPFRADATAVANEVAKAYKGGVISEGEFNHMNRLLDENASPAQLKANIAEFRNLLNGKLESYRKQWESAMPPGVVSPLGTIGGGGGRQGAGGGATDNSGFQDQFPEVK
jgi:hypothetical protein